MKKFNLKQAIKGIPVKTRSGLSVSNLEYSNIANNVYALSGIVNLLEVEYKWTRCGNLYMDLILPHDLIME